MSEKLLIVFDADMPVAVVEVLASDMRIHSRIMLEPGASRDLEMPPGQAVLRVRMPDGEVVTLEEVTRPIMRISRGQLLAPRQAVSPLRLAEVDELTVIERSNHGAARHRRRARPEANVQGGGRPLGARAHKHIAQFPSEGLNDVVGDMEVAFETGARIRLTGAPLARAATKPRGVKYLMDQSADVASRPFVLSWSDGGGAAVEITLPASTSEIDVRWIKTRGRPRLSVLARTRSPHADAILGFLASGDMYSARALTEWVDQAEWADSKVLSDPYSSTVAAFLLLRLREFGRMKEWIRQVADRFEFLADACVIWAWQLVHLRRGETIEAKKYFFKACDRPLPVYSEGLRLLLDGLCLYSHEGDERRRALMARAARATTDAPVIYRTSGREGEPRSIPTVDVHFAN